MPSPDENFPHKNDRTFHQRCLSRSRDEPAETPLAPARFYCALWWLYYKFEVESSCLCLSGKLWYLQHICVEDIIVYHKDSHDLFTQLFPGCPEEYGYNQPWPNHNQTKQTVNHVQISWDVLHMYTDQWKDTLSLVSMKSHEISS